MPVVGLRGQEPAVVDLDGVARLEPRDDVGVARAEDGDVVHDVDQEEAGADGHSGGDDQVGAQDLSLRRAAETDRDGDGRRAVRPSPSRVDLPAGLARLRLDGKAEGRRLPIGDHAPTTSHRWCTIARWSEGESWPR